MSRAYPTSFPLPPGGPRLGIGQAVKRDAVMVKVTTEDGIVGWGESHHGRAHTAVATLIQTTLRQLILGMDAFDTTGINARIYKFQLASHGMGAGCALAMSGIDMAIWDAKAKALNLPLYKLLGGSRAAGAGLCRRRGARLPGARRADRRGRAAYGRPATRP